MENNTPKNKLKLGTLLPIALLVGILGFVIFQNQARKISLGEKSQQIVDEECTSRAYSEIGGPFNLINQDGLKVSEKDFLGSPVLLYFGYTYCPDVCPNSLTLMGKSLELLGQKNPQLVAQFKPVMVSIDPERDTSERLKEYVTTPAFPKGLIGLTGDINATTSAAKNFKVAFKKNENKDDKDAYTVDHSSLIYLLGRDGKLKTFFSDNTNPEKIAQCLAVLNENGL